MTAQESDPVVYTPMRLSTRNKLKSLGHKSESYDEVIMRLLKALSYTDLEGE